MTRRPHRLLLPLIVVIIALGCASRVPYTISQDFESKAIRAIAVLPVENKTSDVKAPQLLRKKIIDQLYFKGYAMLLPAELDKRLETINNIQKYGKDGFASHQRLHELLAADAVMFCSLAEGNRSRSIFSAYVAIAISCELQGLKTGEILWRSQYRATSRNFDVTRKRLELKSYEIFEDLMEDVVNKVVETLPVGPNLRG